MMPPMVKDASGIVHLVKWRADKTIWDTACRAYMGWGKAFIDAPVTCLTCIDLMTSEDLE